MAGLFADWGILKLMSNSPSLVSRLVRRCKRTALVALAGLLLSGLALPTPAAAYPHASTSPGSTSRPPIAHVMDGQGDSPLVP